MSVIFQDLTGILTFQQIENRHGSGARPICVGGIDLVKQFQLFGRISRNSNEYILAGMRKAMTLPEKFQMAPENSTRKIFPGIGLQVPRLDFIRVIQ